MSKNSKTLIIAGLCFVCISMIISLFNFNTLLRPFFTSSDYNKKIFTSESTGEINSIIVDTTNEKIKVLATDIIYVKVTYYENEFNSYEISTNNNELRMIKNSIIRFRLFNFNVFSPSIVIEVPKNMVINYNIKTSNAKIELERLKVNNSIFKTSNASISYRDATATGPLNLISSNGTMILSNMTAEDINIKTSNAKIILDKVNSNNIYLKSSNGSVELNNVTAHYKVEAKTSNAKITLFKLNSSYIDLDTSNGKVSGSIYGDVDEYQKNIKTSNGNIWLNNLELGKRYMDGSGNKILIIDTSNANIKLEFYKD